MNPNPSCCCRRLINIIFIIITFIIPVVPFVSAASESSTPTPTPTPWPEQFHALLFMNLIQLSDLWYNWSKGRNVNIFQKQLTGLLYGVEWNNGTSFYYNVDPVNPDCWIVDFGVGILRPDFLNGAVYLGTRVADGFLCNVWEKEGFIWYYEDVQTKTPVRWDFYDGIRSHVMTFEVGAVLPDSVSQAPEYCFTHGQPLYRDKFTSEKHLRRRMWSARETW